MEKCLSTILEESKNPTCQADLMNFSSPEILPTEMPVGIGSPFIKKLSVDCSDDPFEFHLEKAIMKGRIGKHRSFRQKNANNCNETITSISNFKNSNTPVFEKKRQRPRFSYWDSSLLDKDASFDILNDKITFENSVMINSPLQRRRSLSVDNLSFSLHEKDPVIPFECIKAEAKKIAELIEKSQLFNSKQEESVDKMLTDEVPTGLQISTSSEEGIGLPEVVIFSTKKDSNLDITNKAEYIKYKQFISSRNNSSQQIVSSESKTTNDKADGSTLFDESNSSIDGHKQTKTSTIEEKEKLLKMDHAKLKLLQRDIEEVKLKPLKPIKKKEAKGPEKRGPLKVFAPHNSQILNNTNASRKPLRGTTTENALFSIPVATSTPEPKKMPVLKKPNTNATLSKKSSLKVVKTPVELNHPYSHAKMSIKLDNVGKITSKNLVVPSAKTKILRK